MAEKNENINKKDLELILEVNNKAIEIQTTVVDQNEEVIDLLNSIKENKKESDEKFDKNADQINDKLDKLIKQSEELSKDIFKMQVLFITGLIGLFAQVIQFFMKKIINL